MAVVYLGQNNLSKKISNLYVGINNQSKKVIKGYVGVNGYSKLFYTHNIDIFYPTLKDIQNLGVGNSIYTIDFNYNYQWSNTFGRYPIIVDQKEEGTIRRNAHAYITSASKIHLYGNCSNLFNIQGLSILYDYNHEDVWGLCNLEKYFFFNYVNNLSHFLGNTSSLADHYNIVGNLANCNFINVINMSYAFYGCSGLTESPQCGPKVKDMSYAYYNCKELTGSPVCGPNVENMAKAYWNCYNLTGNINIGERVINASYAYYWVGQITKKSLKLDNLYVGKYGAINLDSCFAVAAVYGDIYILNNKSNINRIFYSSYLGNKKINIHYPINYTLTSLNSKISSYLIHSASSNNEIHTIVDNSYIDIRDSQGVSYNIRIYNDYIES